MSAFEFRWFDVRDEQELSVRAPSGLGEPCESTELEGCCLFTIYMHVRVLHCRLNARSRETDISPLGMQMFRLDSRVSSTARFTQDMVLASTGKNTAQPLYRIIVLLHRYTVIRQVWSVYKIGI